MTDDKVGGKNGGKDGGLKEKLDLDEVELDLPLKAVTENVTENVTDNVTEKLSERQRKIIEIISADPKISAEKIAKAVGVSSRTVKRDLLELTKKQIIVREGNDKDGERTIVS